MKTKPLWIEQFMDDEDLYEVFTSITMEMIDRIPKDLEEVIDLERHSIKAKKAMMTRKLVSYTPVVLSIGKRLLDRFEQNKFLPSKLIEEYRQKINHIQDMVLGITIRENLQKEADLK